MKQIRLTLISVAAAVMAVIGLAGVYAPAVSALDENCEGFDCVTKDTNVNEINTRTGNDKSVDSLAKTITNTLLYLLGAISVIMIVYGGVLYTTSGGDANAATKAKNTILYAVVGLAVALVGYAIVNLVLKTF